MGLGLSSAEIYKIFNYQATLNKRHTVSLRDNLIAYLLPQNYHGCIFLRYRTVVEEINTPPPKLRLLDNGVYYMDQSPDSFGLFYRQDIQMPFIQYEHSYCWLITEP